MQSRPILLRGISPAADFCRAFGEFGGLGAQINHLRVAIGLSIVESYLVATNYDRAPDVELQERARFRNPCEYEFYRMLPAGRFGYKTQSAHELGLRNYRDRAPMPKSNNWRKGRNSHNSQNTQNNQNLQIPNSGAGTQSYRNQHPFRPQYRGGRQNYARCQYVGNHASQEGHRQRGYRNRNNDHGGNRPRNNQRVCFRRRVFQRRNQQRGYQHRLRSSAIGWVGPLSIIRIKLRSLSYSPLRCFGYSAIRSK